MLKFFTRLEKTRNFVMLLFAVLMVASLVFFYAPTTNNVSANLARSDETAAKVKGEKITVGELFRQKENYSRFMQGRPYPAKLILDGLISSRVVRVEADRLGLTATDKEVGDAIREQFKPTDGSAFDQKRYEQSVTEQFGSVQAFEESVRDDLSQQKLRAFITSGITISEQELLDDYKKRNTKFDLSYVVLSPQDLAKSITPSEQELQDYFQKNKAAYYISVPQKKIKYIFVNTAKIGEKLPVTDAELHAEYDALPADKKKAGVLGQEIVLRVPKPDQADQVLAKASEIVQNLKKEGDTVSEEAFANAAKGFSENPATAPLGGKLKGPVRENPNNATDPYQRLLAMKPGEITEPISYQGRYFILRRGDEVPKSFEDAKPELEVSLRNRKAYAVAAELAQKISDTLKQNHDIQATVQQYAAQANMSPADMVRETGYVKPGDNVENIGTSPQFEEGIAPLANVNDVGDKIPVQNGFAVPMLVDKKEPRDAEFAEVKDQIVEAVKVEKARNEIADIANQIAAGATSADALAAAAQGKGLTAETQQGYIVGTPLGKGPSATTSDELEAAILAMRDGQATNKPIKIGENYYIVGVKHRDEANMDEFAKKRDELMEQMLSRKRGEVFADYIAAARRRLESDGYIKVYNDAVAKVDESDATETE